MLVVRFNTTKNTYHFYKNFFFKHNIETVLDIGCGDWQFSQYINFDNIKYRGIDIVPSVIEENNKYVSENIDFVCGDISDYNQLEPYTNVDLILVKDVLQHWSNDEIDNFLSKITKSNAKYMLITSAYKHFRDKNKNGTERNIDNKYSFAPLDLMQPKYNQYNFKKVLKYQYKEVILWKK